MFIRYPTAFYKPLLPAKDSDAGDVTFTISTEEPPRPRNASVKVPAGIAPLIDRKPIPRSVLGDLVFTINDSSATILLNSTSQYVLGDVLEFLPDTIQRNAAIAPSSLLEIRHDLTRIDYEALGLSPADIAVLAQASATTQDQLRLRLNQKQTEFEDNNTEISNTKKLISETEKALAAALVILNSTPISLRAPIQQIIDKLQDNLQILESKLNDLIANSTTISAEINDLINQTRSVGVVVI